MKDSIYRKLIQRYASEEPTVLKEAAYNLSLASAGEVVEAEFWNRAEKAVARIKQAQSNKTPNILTEAAKKAYANNKANCPICKTKMNLVKLLEGRPVFYCQDHKVVELLPIEEGE